MQRIHVNGLKTASSFHGVSPTGQQRYATRRAAFTLIELVVVTAIVSVIVALALPAISKARAAAGRIQCANNLRNLAIAMAGYEETERRLPASGYYYVDPANPTGPVRPHHNWVISTLPYVEQANLSEQWDRDRPIQDPVNQPLTQEYVAVLICPSDISRNRKKQGDLSYVVNGGLGFTARIGGVHDCALHPGSGQMDLNGNGVVCPTDPSTDGSPSDRDLFKKMGVFFLETWKSDITTRHHRIADISDGTSQTFLISENVRTGFNPSDPDAHFASPNPFLCAFYVGYPCPAGSCTAGAIDYALCNQGDYRINSGLFRPEGDSPVPNSFHTGGVNMTYADGHLSFLAESIDGRVYAALASPQGATLDGTPLEQMIVSEEQF